MNCVHIIALLFFTILLLNYTLFNKNIIENMNDDDVDDISTTILADIITINKDLNEIIDTDKKLDNLDKESKQNSQDIKDLSLKMSSY